jgi:formylglycine-generating enzyme required for sulfatase activity
MRRIIALLVSLLAGSCGGKDAPPASPATQAPPAQAATEYPVPSWAKVAPEQIEAAKAAGVPVAFENSIGMRFVLIPAGTFMMGSQEDEAGRDDDETLHEVMLTRPFYLGETEVTNAQYAMARPHHASGQVGRHRFDGDDQPACGVSWDDATSFARWLTRREANNLYRLPTEAEW